ncbi:uncharacterized protein LOC135836337 [Planococcus citri]|uniref:uncharacterized protein LOC135836337 n=1 Tax=Planococcus citri TaxID=170843 RepID=UPI0031F827CB
MQNILDKNSDHREGVWTLVNYGYKEDDKTWTTIFPKKDERMSLILKNMCLIILNGNELLENFSFLMHDIKRIAIDNDSMGIALEQGATKRRLIRVRFSGKMMFPGEHYCDQCAKVLSHYIVPNYVNKDNQLDQPSKVSLSQYVSEFIKNTKGLPSQKYEELVSVYPLEDIIEDCILDVNFPDIVAQVHSILESKLNSK